MGHVSQWRAFEGGTEGRGDPDKSTIIGRPHRLPLHCSTHATARYLWADMMKGDVDVSSQMLPRPRFPGSRLLRFASSQLCRWWRRLQLFT